MMREKGETTVLEMKNFFELTVEGFVRSMLLYFGLSESSTLKNVAVYYL